MQPGKRRNRAQSENISSQTRARALRALWIPRKRKSGAHQPLRIAHGRQRQGAAKTAEVPSATAKMAETRAAIFSKSSATGKSEGFLTAIGRRFLEAPWHVSSDGAYVVVIASEAQLVFSQPPMRLGVRGFLDCGTEPSSPTGNKC